MVKIFGLTLYQQAVTQRCSIRKVFLQISQNSQANNCARVSFTVKLLASRSGTDVSLRTL